MGVIATAIATGATCACVEFLASYFLAKCLRASEQEATAPGAQQRHAVATPDPTAGRQRGGQAINSQQGGRIIPHVPPISAHASIAVATPGPTAGSQRGVPGQETNSQQGVRLPPISAHASIHASTQQCHAAATPDPPPMLSPAIQSQAAALRLGPIQAQRHPVQFIRYTQDSIKRKFQNGNTVESAIEDLHCERKRVDEFPAIRVFQSDGLVFCCDNRRLYVFKQLAKRRGDADMMVPVKWVKPLSQGHAKFTTRNAGTGIRIR
eukprot:1414431-Amphidinium_carterae.1